MTFSFDKISSGVYKCDDPSTSSLECVEGKIHYRLMDFFFIEKPADELSIEQVLAICHARANDPRCSSGANQSVRLLFKQFLNNPDIQNILEVGAGNNPILTSNDIKARDIGDYVISDADSEYQCVKVLFGESNKLTTYPAEHFDVVIALFVLHFKFYTSQIEQIYEHLKPSGIFLANVYNRSKESRDILINDFEKAGFLVQLIEDTQKHCKDHFYLFAAKDMNVINNQITRFTSLIN